MRRRALEHPGWASSVACAVLAAACNSAPAGGTLPSASASAPLEPGAKVLVVRSVVSLREGEVVRSTADEVTYAHGKPDAEGNRPSESVARAQVWLIGAPLDAAAGDHLACRVADLTWYPCKVLESAGSGVTALDAHGDEHRLEASALVEPDAATQTSFASYLERSHKHRGFDQAFAAAGKPYRPAGWRPRPGDKVIVHFVGTSWYGAKLIEPTAKDQLRVDWDGDTWDDRDVTLDEMAPQPGAEGAPAAPAVGSFVLVRPPRDAERWEHAKVTAVKGQKLEVVNRDDVRREVSAGDLVSLVPAS
jgi:hypothetical protein